ncbi:MAG: sugar phosphate isomerase/epimerase [Chloroflexi bacterium]|nr:sugar phosphate isomerase/epimerase [Chloroflexota bacterium]MCY3583785.1 sugar phosphate isomerase/epimerase [Chloroflexota bacterium]MCY3716195.1 sugar phosphate isomerase/epimerase [Chloroflexota bacterium]MDE2650850.1 sugar phosphate isomerase/epimerase [Chloroflexota bacterium]MXX82995.1 sugar phosphate isomerase/epimerase [Chloroflexota bacterium]
MDTSLIAAQLYTIRQHTQTVGDFARSMEKIRAIGYRAVQVSAIGAISDEDVKRIAADNGLRICNTHIDFERLQHDLEAVIAQHQLWDCRHIAIGSMPAAFRDSADGYKRFAALGSQIGERLAAADMTFSYHNHSFEFVKFDGRAGLEILFDESDPRYLQAELDTYWVQHGGGDPVAWIDRLTGRMPVVHLKDMVMLPGEPGEGPQQAMAEVGAGNLNFPGILAACQRAGVQWYAVEQDICQRDPFESLAISFANLARMD